MKRVLMVGLMAASAWMGTMEASAEGNPWMIRARAIGVMPDEGASLKVGGGALPGDASISDTWVPELDFTYFFTDHIAAELILATSKHDVKATGVTVPGVLNSATVPLGDVWVLPPTLTLQYHFNTDGAFKPYVGAGVNATMFYNEDEGPVADGIEYDPSFGFALQAGADYDLDGVPGGWALNVDVKKIWMNTDVTVDLTSALGPSLGAASVKVNGDVDIDPVVVGIGLGYKF